MSPFNVVIAEDDHLLARVLAIHCRAMGGHVRVAPDAMMALTYMHKQLPDIVLLDLDLPAGSGTGVMEMMRSDKRLSEVPVIVYSGTSDESEIDRVTEMGGYFMPKASDDWAKVKRLMQSLILERRQRAPSPRRGEVTVK